MSHSLTQLANEPVQTDVLPPSELYQSRKLAEAYPGLDQVALERFIATLESQGDETPTDSTRRAVGYNKARCCMIRYSSRGILCHTV